MAGASEGSSIHSDTTVRLARRYRESKRQLVSALPNLFRESRRIGQETTALGPFVNGSIKKGYEDDEAMAENCLECI